MDFLSTCTFILFFPSTRDKKKIAISLEGRENNGRNTMVSQQRKIEGKYTRPEERKEGKYVEFMAKIPK